MPTLANNKKAFFDYHILETFQAGLVLSGPMVKLIRQRKINLAGKFVIWQKKQLQIIDLGNEKLSENVPLLLEKSEIRKILQAIQQKGITCIVLEIYTSGRWLKAKIALARGKKKWDKRETLKQRDLDREQAQY